MIQRMCISETFSLATPFAFILLIPFLLYYSLKTFIRPASTLKELPAHHEYRLPDFLVSPHVDKTKYLRRVMKLKEQIKHREQESNCNSISSIERIYYGNQSIFWFSQISQDIAASDQKHTHKQMRTATDLRQRINQFQLKQHAQRDMEKRIQRKNGITDSNQRNQQLSMKMPNIEH